MEYFMILAVVANIACAFLFVSRLKRFVTLSDYEEYLYLKCGALAGPLFGLFVFFWLASSQDALGIALGVIANCLIGPLLAALYGLLSYAGRSLKKRFPAVFGESDPC